ncbi:hypothetical protein HWV62_5442 [Athelia sp. TMB]|nr:hypothetical protein HWV62_5442 [Athelia sp. TMB]
MFTSRSTNAEYTSLAPSDEDVIDSEKQYSREGGPSTTPRHLYLAIFAVGVLCIFNFAQTNFFPRSLVTGHSKSKQAQTMSEVAVDPQYAYTAPDQIVRVSAGAKSAVFGASKSVHVSVEDNSFMEFQIPKGSASMCQLSFIPPPQTPSTRLIGELSEIEAWEVSSAPSSYDNISWRNRPSGNRLLATLDLSDKKVEALSQEFECGSEHHRTIEFRCLRVACGVEYYADGKSGIYRRSDNAGKADSTAHQHTAKSQEVAMTRRSSHQPLIHIICPTSFTTRLSTPLSNPAMKYLPLPLYFILPAAMLSQVNAAQAVVRAGFNIHFPFVTRKPSPDSFCGVFSAMASYLVSDNELGEVFKNPSQFAAFDPAFVSFSGNAGDLVSVRWTNQTRVPRSLADFPVTLVSDEPIASSGQLCLEVAVPQPVQERDVGVFLFQSHDSVTHQDTFMCVDVRLVDDDDMHGDSHPAMCAAHNETLIPMPDEYL